MNTILSIINVLRHLTYLAFYLLYSLFVLILFGICVTVSYPTTWMLMIFFFYGYVHSIINAVETYKREWENKGTFWKSFIYLITRK